MIVMKTRSSASHPLCSWIKINELFFMALACWNSFGAHTAHIRSRILNVFMLTVPLAQTAPSVHNREKRRTRFSNFSLIPNRPCSCVGGIIMNETYFWDFFFPIHSTQTFFSQFLSEFSIVRSQFQSTSSIKIKKKKTFWRIFFGRD